MEFRKLAEEGKEALKDRLAPVRNVIEEPLVATGGDGFEVELALKPRRLAYSVPKRPHGLMLSDYTKMVNQDFRLIHKFYKR